MKVHGRTQAALLMAAMLLGAGCGTPTGQGATVTPAGEAPAPTAAPQTSAPVTPTPSPTDPTAAVGNATPQSAQPSGPPIVVASPGSGRRELVLADAFDPGDWTEGSYTPANETTAVRAMATQVRCRTSRPETLEFRFAQVQGRLMVQVAQDMRSDSPDFELEFSLTADGRQVDVKNADFKGKPELSADLAGITVLRIGVQAAPGTANSGCEGSANALITSIVVEQ